MRFFDVERRQCEKHMAEQGSEKDHESYPKDPKWDFVNIL